MGMLTRTLLLTAALDRRGLANTFLAAALGQLCIRPGARLCAATTSLVAFVPRVGTPDAVDYNYKERARMNKQKGFSSDA